MAERLPQIGRSDSAERVPMTPREIVSELDRYIVGQRAAKRAVAIALRNRWRRQQVAEDLRDEIAPKNIIMIGPTGVGKTEISRRLAKLAQAPFLKVEASKFTEVGYVGRDVESMIRDLTELAVSMVKEEEREKVAARAREHAEERVLDLLLPPRPVGIRPEGASGSDRDDETQGDAGEASPHAPRRQARRPARRRRSERVVGPHAADHDSAGHGGDRAELEGPVLESDAEEEQAPTPQSLRGHRATRGGGGQPADRHGHGGQGSGAPRGACRHRVHRRDRQDRRPARACTVRTCRARACSETCCPSSKGSTVSTKYGMVRTDHILFIASGAFHVSKPSDLIPEFQGRFPIRVELDAADTGGLRPHPHRAEERADHAVRRADGDRGGATRFLPGRRRRDRAHRRAGERAHREHRRAPSAHGRSSGCSTSVSFDRARDARPGGGHRRRQRARAPRADSRGRRPRRYIL